MLVKIRKGQAYSTSQFTVLALGDGWNYRLEWGPGFDHDFILLPAHFIFYFHKFVLILIICFLQVCCVHHFLVPFPFHSFCSTLWTKFNDRIPLGKLFDFERIFLGQNSWSKLVKMFYSLD